MKDHDFPIRNLATLNFLWRVLVKLAVQLNYHKEKKCHANWLTGSTVKTVEH